MTAGSSTADPRGIPGWDKVGQLAEVLIQLTGIAVSAAQARLSTMAWKNMIRGL